MLSFCVRPATKRRRARSAMYGTVARTTGYKINPCKDYAQKRLPMHPERREEQGRKGPKQEIRGGKLYCG